MNCVEFCLNIDQVVDFYITASFGGSLPIANFKMTWNPVYVWKPYKNGRRKMASILRSVYTRSGFTEPPKIQTVYNVNKYKGLLLRGSSTYPYCFRQGPTCERFILHNVPPLELSFQQQEPDPNNPENPPPSTDENGYTILQSYEGQPKPWDTGDPFYAKALERWERLIAGNNDASSSYSVLGNCHFTVENEDGSFTTYDPTWQFSFDTWEDGAQADITCSGAPGSADGGSATLTMKKR